MLEHMRRRLAALRAALETVRERRATSRAALDEIVATAEGRAEGERDLTDDEQTRFSTLHTEVRGLDADITSQLAEIDQCEAEVRALEEADEREQRANAAHERNGGTGRVGPVPGSWAHPELHEVRGMSRGQRRDHAARIIERAGPGKNNEGIIDEARQAQLTQLVARRDDYFDGDVVAERMIITESPGYRRAFQKYARYGQETVLSPDEARAVAEWQSYALHAERIAGPTPAGDKWAERAASEGTASAGGYGVPVVIDPTIILTSGAAVAPLLGISRVEQITTNLWKGVSSAAPAWSFDAEAAEVSDDMTTLAQPAITAYTARGHIPYSVEVAQDYPGFATEIQALLEQGYVDLIALKTLMGSGTSEPWGIFPAILAGGVSVQVTSTTDGAFGGVDVFNVWNALPERFRSRASWVMSVSHESAIRQFATGTNAAAYFTVDLTADGISRINGRPVYVTDYAPALSTTTGAASRLVVGDFQHYVIAQRAGITFENIQMLFATANNLPSLQRSRLGWARLGADSVADNGFRILCNT